ncbi:MAG: hypothetical protein JWN49_426 [Parcubacteria group bacterium]|nr:hypothetical protein [Parcubacteria group bacterium]
MNIERIFLPTRPQPDTIVAIFLLREYGTERFPGVDTAHIEIKHSLNEGDTFDSLLEKGTLALDVGGGLFDHHGKNKTATELVADALGIRKNPELTQLIGYAVRDDTQGKGTISKDPLDRAFGLSGIIASLNKMYTDDPHAIVSFILPLLKAHHFVACEHTVGLPNDIERKEKEGKYTESVVKQAGKDIKISFVMSDKPSMPGYLRSQAGRLADVVVQRSEDTNHYAILTKQHKNVNLSKAMALIRLREAELKGIELDYGQIEAVRSLEQIPYWYYDPATNSLLNGGPHNRTVEESHIPWEELQKIVIAGIKLG